METQQHWLRVGHESERGLATGASILKQAHASLFRSDNKKQEAGTKPTELPRPSVPSHISHIKRKRRRGVETGQHQATHTQDDILHVQTFIPLARRCKMLISNEAWQDTNIILVP